MDDMRSYQISLISGRYRPSPIQTCTACFSNILNHFSGQGPGRPEAEQIKLTMANTKTPWMFSMNHETNRGYRKNKSNCVYTAELGE